MAKTAEEIKTEVTQLRVLLEAQLSVVKDLEYALKNGGRKRPGRRTKLEREKIAA